MIRKIRAVAILLLVSLALSTCSSPDSAAVEQPGIPWWGWLLIVLAAVCLAILIWRCLSRRRARSAGAQKDMAVPVAEPPPRLAAAAPAVSEPSAELATPTRAEVEAPVGTEPREPDDLKIVEGIGPKVASLLSGAGITTFAQLASAEVALLEDILERSGLRMMNPATWPEQAGLAAAGRWDELTALKDVLKGGRRA